MLDSTRPPADELARSAPASGRWPWTAVLVVLAVWGVVLGLNARRAGDLHIYALAARRFWGGLPLYPASDGLISFKYSPAAAWLFTPAILLPPVLAGALWNLGSVAAFALAAERWRKALGEDVRSSPSYLALLAATLALGQSFFLELFHGQVNLWMLALLVVPLTPAGRRWESLAGLCVALATVVKPTAALAALALVAMGRTRALAYAVAWGAMLHVPLLARYGWTGAVAELQAWSANLDRTTTAWAVGYNAQGFPTLLLSALYPADARASRTLVAAAELVSVAALLAGTLLSRIRGAGLWAILCLGATLVSPLAWRANFLLAWPMLVALLSIGPMARGWARTAVVAVAAVEWIASEAMLGQAAGRAVLETRIWALVFVAATALALWVLPRGARPS